MHVGEREVDGVRTLWAEVPGPVVACLSFRVGQSDEDLTNRGISHLCEHLALSHVGLRQYGFNGSTGTTITNFTVQGELDEVASHLTDLTETVRSGRFLDRLDHERRILEIESHTRGGGVVLDHLRMRYGARSHGIVGWDELGLHRIGRDEVWEWAARHFTRENAVLWLTAEPPAGLKLDLFDGPRNTNVPGPPLRNLLPAWDHEPGPAALTGLTRRSVAAVAAGSIIGRRCFEWLRHQSGMSYSPWSDYMQLDGDVALTALAADGPPEHGAAAAWALWAAVDAVAEEGPTLAELDEHKAMTNRHRNDPRAPMSEMSSRADAMLHGRPVHTAEALAAEVEALDVSQVRAVAAELRDTVIVQLPLDAEPPGWSLVEYALADDPVVLDVNAVERRVYLDVTNWSGGDALLYSNEMVGLEESHRPHGVRVSPTTTMLAWGDGSRTLVDETGRGLVIRPSAWQMGNEIVSWLDALIPPERVIALGVRRSPPTGSVPFALRRIPGFGPAGVMPSEEHQLIGPIVLDVWPPEEPLPPGVPESRRGLPGALMLGWLAHRNLLSSWLEASAPETLAAFRNGQMAPSTLFREVGDAFVTDLVAPTAVCWVADLMVPPYESASSRYVELLTHAAGGEPWWRLTERQHLSAVWTVLDNEWQARPRKGPAWLVSNLSPEVPPLPVPSSRCQPIA